MSEDPLLGINTLATKLQSLQSQDCGLKDFLVYKITCICVVAAYDSRVHCHVSRLLCKTCYSAYIAALVQQLMHSLNSLRRLLSVTVVWMATAIVCTESV